LLTSTDLQTRRARCQHQLSFMFYFSHSHSRSRQSATWVKNVQRISFRDSWSY